MAAIPIAGICGGPLSGWILQVTDGLHGWRGWQWLFLLEAVPAIVVGVTALFYLDNGIQAARWLTDEEKALLEDRLAADRKHLVEHPTLAAVFRDRRLWRMCAIYFACVMGQYGLTFWMPTLIQSAGVRGTLHIGLLTAIPYSISIVGMILFGRSADRTRERRWHAVSAMLLGAVALSASALAGTHTVLAIVCLSMAAMGVMSCAPLFWSLPTAVLGGTAAAAGIAAINSIGNLAGFVSPYVVGWLKDLTHSTAAGMYAVSAVLVIGALIVLTIPGEMVDR
jgi:nitrate/nitrite transporter NarK